MITKAHTQPHAAKCTQQRTHTHWENVHTQTHPVLDWRQAIEQNKHQVRVS